MNQNVNGVNVRTSLYNVSRKKRQVGKKETRFEKDISLLLKRMYKNDTDNSNYEITDARQRKKRKCEKETPKYEKDISHLFTCLNICENGGNDNNSIEKLSSSNAFFADFIVYRKASRFLLYSYLGDMNNKGFYIFEMGKIIHVSSLENRLKENESCSRKYIQKCKVNREKDIAVERYFIEIRTELIVSDLMSEKENVWMNEVVDVAYDLEKGEKVFMNEVVDVAYDLEKGEKVLMNEAIDVAYDLEPDESGLHRIKSCAVSPMKHNVTNITYIIDANQYKKTRPVNVLKKNIFNDFLLKNMFYERVIFFDNNLTFTNLNAYNLHRILQSSMEFAKTEYSLFKLHENLIFEECVYEENLVLCEELEEETILGNQSRNKTNVNSITDETFGEKCKGQQNFILNEYTFEDNLVICEEPEAETNLVNESCNKINIHNISNETFDTRHQHLIYDEFTFESDLVICEEPEKETILTNQSCNKTYFNNIAEQTVDASSSINNTILDLFMLEIRIKQCRDVLKKFGVVSDSYDSFKKLKLKSAKLIKTYKILMNKKRQRESRQLKAMKRACVRRHDILPESTLTSSDYLKLDLSGKLENVDKETVPFCKKRVSHKPKKHTDKDKCIPGRSKRLDECIIRMETSKNNPKFNKKSKYLLENKILQWQNKIGAKELKNNEVESEKKATLNDPFDKEIDKILSQLPPIEDLPNLSKSSDKKYISVGINESLDFDIGNGESFVIFPYITA